MPLNCRYHMLTQHRRSPQEPQQHSWAFNFVWTKSSKNKARSEFSSFKTSSEKLARYPRGTYNQICEIPSIRSSTLRFRLFQMVGLFQRDTKSWTCGQQAGYCRQNYKHVYGPLFIRKKKLKLLLIFRTPIRGRITIEFDRLEIVIYAKNFDLVN